MRKLRSSGSAEFPDREIPRRLHQLESLAHLRRRLPVRNHLLDRLAARQHIGLSCRGLQQVAARQRRGAERKQQQPRCRDPLRFRAWTSTSSAAQYATGCSAGRLRSAISWWSARRPTTCSRVGYRPVGKDFPVFLHPDTGEQYALARTERKTGPGYYGFATHFAPDVTLEQDLARRDLTINAMAQAATGEIIDPYGGQRDLEARVLRHVSPAFVEDPLRVLRVARFAARFASLGFRVAPETLELMRAIAASGELAALVPERVWVETERALGEAQPVAYLEVLRGLRRAGARSCRRSPRCSACRSPTHWHPEVDTGEHTLQVLDVAAELSPDTTVRFAALVHDVGKGLTPRDQWPRHIGHEETGAR